MHTLTKDYLLGGSTKEALEKREADGATKCFSSSHQCPQTGTVLSCRHLLGVASEWIDFEKLKTFEDKIYNRAAASTRATNV